MIIDSEKKKGQFSLSGSQQFKMMKNVTESLAGRIGIINLHFLDTGLAAYLTKWNTIDVLMNGAMAGVFFETFIISEIKKHADPKKDDISAFSQFEVI